jgi:CRISPR/Cas system-associated protein Cas10 (large subunit of type III CRISPR-Cas system)
MDLGLEQPTEIIYRLPCPICGEMRNFASKSYFYKARKYNKPCRSCSNSIQLGGKGCLIKNNKKICSYCNIYKDFNDFGTNGDDKLKSRCKDCQTIYNKQYHKEVFRFDRYGITKEIFNQMLIDQYNACVICKIIIDESSSHIDHCHKTGKVRGILCEKCNKGLGQFDDNVEFLTNAIKYLNK